jgi:parallel beta-helix repeat protein
MLAVLIGAGTSTARATGGVAASHVSCGQTITTDTKLDSDLVNCPNNGIVIGADNITLDLNGHVIDGDGTEFSACPTDEPCDTGVVDLGHSGVTIKGGTVREFGLGALVVGATDSRVTGLALSNNLFLGLIVADSSRSEIDRIAASKNGLTTDQAGIGVFDSRELVITRNAVFENGDIGMFIVGLDDSRFEANSLSSNPEAGVILEGSGNEVTHNRVSDGQDALIVFGDANTVARNWLSGTGTCPGECGLGVSLEGGADNVIEGNAVLRFHQAGIRIASFDPEVPTVGNTVRRNLIQGLERRRGARRVHRRRHTGGAEHRYRRGRRRHRCGQRCDDRHPKPRIEQRRPRHRGGSGRDRRRRQRGARQRQPRPMHERQLQLAASPQGVRLTRAPLAGTSRGRPFTLPCRRT